jgi:hypothetical protein
LRHVKRAAAEKVHFLFASTTEGTMTQTRTNIAGERIPVVFWLVLWLILAFAALLFLADPAARIPPTYQPWEPWPQPMDGAQ